MTKASEPRENQYPGRCVATGRRLEPGQGILLRMDGRNVLVSREVAAEYEQLDLTQPRRINLRERGGELRFDGWILPRVGDVLVLMDEQGLIGEGVIKTRLMMGNGCSGVTITREDGSTMDLGMLLPERGSL